MQYNRKEAVAICEEGINFKRMGNFGAALLYYQEAKEADPSFSHIYMNSAKIHLGLGEFEKAFRNLLVYAHLNMTDAMYNNEEAKKTVIFDIMPAYYHWKIGKIYGNNFKLSENPFSGDDFAKFFWQAAGDINLTRYAGLCFLGLQPLTAQKIGFETFLMQDQQKTVLGKGKNMLASHALLSQVLEIGFLFLTANLRIFDEKQKLCSDVLKISNIYFDTNSFSINTF
jgi:tetratricopeptide (TPR) repeat protein